MPGKLPETDEMIKQRIQEIVFDEGQIGDVFYGITDGSAENIAYASNDGELFPEVGQAAAGDRAGQHRRGRHRQDGARSLRRRARGDGQGLRRRRRNEDHASAQRAGAAIRTRLRRAAAQGRGRR
jgi:hypothetical protein